MNMDIFIDTYTNIYTYVAIGYYMTSIQGSI
jgi:hypothetical protein